MKKSLIALAVMAAAGAASAQSSVQLYGIADVWFGGVKATGSKAQTVLEDGSVGGSRFVDGSRFGLKGSEDLGGGLKAIFTLEQGFTLDNGALNKDAAGKEQTGFNREATVGLQGNFGTVKLGKQFNAFDDVSSAAATVFDGTLTPMNTVFESAAFGSTDANTVKYISPSFSGFSGSVSYSFGENKKPGVDATNDYALAGKYANGPFAAGIGYGVKDLGAAGEDKATRLNGSYNFGVATLKASYGLVDYASNFETNEYEIGVDYPVAPNLILSAGYAYSENENAAGVKQSDNSGLGLAAAYLLSKRTTAYAGVRSTKLDKVVGTDVTTNVYAVGVKHAF